MKPWPHRCILPPRDAPQNSQDLISTGLTQNPTMPGPLMPPRLLDIATGHEKQLLDGHKESQTSAAVVRSQKPGPLQAPLDHEVGAKRGLHEPMCDLSAILGAVMLKILESRPTAVIMHYNHWRKQGITNAYPPPAPTDTWNIPTNIQCVSGGLHHPHGGALGLPRGRERFWRALACVAFLMRGCRFRGLSKKNTQTGLGHLKGSVLSDQGIFSLGRGG